MVQRPSSAPEPVRILLDNPDAYRVVPIHEADVGNLELPDGSPVYTYEKVGIGGRERPNGIEVETLCTRGLLLASTSKLDAEMLSRLSRAMLDSGPQIIGE
jgi:hypothetical protein